MRDRTKRLGFSIADVNTAYSGFAGELWEMLMGEEIHVGGERETDLLAARTAVRRDAAVLDVCSALGGPTRHLARTYGCCVAGLDATQKMVEEAIRRSEREELAQLVGFSLGNALDLPFKGGTFDVVWGQDAWCHVTDKGQLLKEAFRVLRPGGRIGFTDWIQTGPMEDAEWTALNSFMVFPYMETLSGYVQLLDQAGFILLQAEDLSLDFRDHCHLYLERLRSVLKDSVVGRYGADCFSQAEEGLQRWVRAADEGKVGRGRWVATKPDQPCPDARK